MRPATLEARRTVPTAIIAVVLERSAEEVTRLYWARGACATRHVAARAVRAPPAMKTHSRIE